MAECITEGIREVLQCPECHGPLFEEGPENGDISWVFRCGWCRTMFPVSKGVPRMMASPPEGEASAKSFGFEWRVRELGLFETDTLYGLTKEQELSNFFKAYGIGPADLQNKRVLDAGCGDGALLELISGYGAEIVGVDINTSIDVTYHRCRSLPDVMVLQGDIFRPCFKPASFDFVWCEGVVVHTPDPERAFKTISRLVKPGGRLYVWVYPRDRLSVYQKVRDLLIAPYLIPRPFLVPVCYLIGGLLLPAFRITGRKRSLRTIAFDLFDNLSVKYQWRYTEAEIRRWFEGMGFDDLRVTGYVGLSGRKARMT